jgi:pilus assembly protein CpaE
MKNVVRVAIVDPNDSTRAKLKDLLLGLDQVWLDADCSRYEFFTDVVSQSRPDIALVSLDSDSQKALALVAKLSQELAGTSVLVLSNSQEGSLILQAMRNGAKEFLNYPLNIEDFLAALDRIQQTNGGQNGDGRVRSSQVITVSGVGGGVGCTSLAINLACILAQNERNSVALIDLDLALGDADVWLDIIPDYTIQDVAENITRLDYSLLKRSLTKHDCGAFLLPRPVQMENTTAITPDELRRVLTLLKATFTHLVIDVSKSFGALDLAAMEASDAVLLVTQLDLPCLRNVVRMMQFFDQRDTLAEKIQIVVNRLGLEDSQISLNKALETIGREITWQIPNDYATMVDSRNNGVPLVVRAPKAKVTKALEKMAKSFDGTISKDSDTVEEKKTRKGLFGFLSSK